MAIARLACSDVVANAIILLNESCGRRTLTVREYNIFWQNLINNSKGIEIGRSWYNDDALNEYFDIIDIKELGLVYRLKPYYTIDNLIEKFHGYLNLNLYLLLSDKSLLNGVCELTKEDENNILEFKILDEKYQLEFMHKLFDLEKQKRMLERKFNVVKQYSISLVDDIMVENIFENKPSISSESLIDTYQNNKSR